MCERITELLGGWSLYWWTGMLTDRTSGLSRTVNSPEQVQLSSSIRSVMCTSVLPPVSSCVCLYTQTVFFEVGIPDSRAYTRWWLRKLNQNKSASKGRHRLTTFVVENLSLGDVMSCGLTLAYQRLRNVPLSEDSNLHSNRRESLPTQQTQALLS